MDPITTKLLATSATSTALKPVADSIVSPLLKRFGDSILSRIDKKEFSAQIDGYLKAMEEKLRVINSVIFPKEGADLYSIYEPIILQRKQVGRVYNVLVDKLPPRLVSLNKIIISDSAGMGKSTVLKYLFLKATRADQYIPIFVELRRLRRDKDMIQIIKQDVGGSFSNISDKNVLEIIKHGKFLIFLDGLDEIQDGDEEIISHLKNQIDDLRDCKIIISSRPERPEVLFPNFKIFTIKPLKKSQAYSIITRVSHDNAIGRKLISDLELSRKIDNSMNEFLTNPLLVSLLYKAYEHKPSIPEQKHMFYASVFDALYESHDYRKDGTYKRKKNSGLNYTVFLRITSLLGHITAYDGKIEFQKPELLKYITTIKGVASDVSFDKNDYLLDICNAVPLFVKEGPLYRWSHKSLQDYFSAYYISNFSNDPVKIINSIISSSNPMRYLSVLDLIKEMKPGFIEKNYIIPFLKGFIEFNQQPSCENVLYRRRFYAGHLPTILESEIIINLAKNIRDDKMQHVILSSNGYIQEDPLYVLLEASYNSHENVLDCKALSFKNDMALDNEEAIVEIDHRNFNTYLELTEESEATSIDVLSTEVLSIPYCEKIISRYDNSEKIIALPDIF
jgi:NACHT domain